MFSIFIQSKVEEQLGKSIESVDDCDRVALSISEKTDMRISAATLRGLFGINSKSKEPSVFTTEVLAIYLGYASGIQLRSEYNHFEFERLNATNNGVFKEYTSICVSAFGSVSKVSI
jgi:hypothetical protein